MGTIFTASFNKLHRLADYYQLAISNGLPLWFKGGRYKALKPSYEFVKLLKAAQQGEMTLEDIELFSVNYYEEVLAKLDPHEVYEELMQQAQGKPVVLLSQEDSDEFSIRHVVRAWLIQAGIDCQEIT